MSRGRSVRVSPRSWRVRRTSRSREARGARNAGSGAGGSAAADADVGLGQVLGPKPCRESGRGDIRRVRARGTSERDVLYQEIRSMMAKCSLKPPGFLAIDSEFS